MTIIPNDHHERLVECEHDNQLDAQELRERSASNQHAVCQAIKDYKTVQRHAVKKFISKAESGVLRNNARYAYDIGDFNVGVREMEVEPAILTQYVLRFCDNGDNGNDCENLFSEKSPIN